jgi:hypothetical protein
MTIDLNDIPIGVAESQYQLDILKSGKIYKELLKMSEKKYTCIIVSMPVYNVLVHHDKFYQNPFDSIESTTEVGIFCGYKVFLDLTLQENLIQLTYDFQEKRDNVLDNLLENEEIKKDLKIKVLNC